MERKKSVGLTEQPLHKQSGKVPRHRDHTFPDRDDPSTTATSQLRQRFALEAELEAARAARAREPQFLEDEPEDGVPTPRPKMPLGCVPRRMMDDAEILLQPLDHRAGFVLAHIDGTTSIRTIIDVCGISQNEVATIIERLLSLRVIVLT